jgi:uncharacterized protein YgiM (DUF1202 family)
MYRFLSACMICLSAFSYSEESLSTTFTPFPGRVITNKVRLRLEPSFDGQVYKEAMKSDYLIVLDEKEDFYAIRPPSDSRGYVFRTYILDNIVEGNRVNVRLQPDLSSPIIAQLNSGDRVEGTIDASNNKWLEIKLPNSARFYVAKEYVQSVGNENLLAILEKKREDGYRLLRATESLAISELSKPFDQISINGLKANYNHLINDYPEFPEMGAEAKDRLIKLLEEYTAIKLAFLEKKASINSSFFEVNKKLISELQAEKTRVSQLEKQLAYNSTLQTTPKETAIQKTISMPLNLANWLKVEEELFRQWQQVHGFDLSATDYYASQKKEAFFIKGMIEPYNRPIKNRPGDYIFINLANQLPFAFLYSTQVNLQEYVGKEVSILVSPRPNNHFAFPAYYVFSIEP